MLKKRKRDNIEAALTGFLQDTRDARIEMRKSLLEKDNNEADAYDLFFQSCAKQVKELPPRMKAYVQLQVSQLLFNVENNSFPSSPVFPQCTPLSRVIG